MKRVSEILANVRIENRKNLLEPEAKAICQEYNISVTRFKVAKKEGEVVKFAEEIGFPVVLKIVSLGIIHKSDVGGVMLNLKTANEVEQAYRTILTNAKKHQPNVEISGVLVQEMAPQSTEVIVGAIKDDQFGPSVMFGLGGIFVEILKDVVFRVAPVSKQEAELMITEIKAYPVLRGYRNQPPLDTNAIADVIVNTSKLVMDYQEIKELDLNPVMVYEKGAKTVDARIILE
ncbi:MAG: acetate--CoA ligase family protein [Candidatus Bathyarchaeota archaeon]|nr:acetate--CoA ligase family protein [Candidatus Bathyarchaeota archaeon]MDH5495010.1 acetate--CoA ligase family protein [Candidatus Bathyarchaeota archaeon]